MDDAAILSALDAELDEGSASLCGEPGCIESATTRIVHRCRSAATIVCHRHAVLWWALMPVRRRYQGAHVIRCRGCMERITFNVGDWAEEDMP